MIKLKELINQLKEIRTETKSKVSDEIVFENAVKIYISNKINESKNGVKEQKEEKATDKQIDLLCTLDVNFNSETITKNEAKELITKEINKRKEKKK